MERKDAAAELAPNGRLAVGVVAALSPGVFFVGIDPTDGAPRGVTVEIGKALADEAGLACEFFIFPNSGECTDAVSSGKVDFAFMPVDEERKRRVDFGAAYYQLESTYLATKASGIVKVADADAPGHRIVGIANTTTIRASARSLKHTQPMPERSVAEAVAAIREGRVDALALSRDVLNVLQQELSGTLVVEGGFQHTNIALAVPKGRATALA